MKRSEATRLGNNKEKSPILAWCSVEHRSRIATWETRAFQFQLKRKHHTGFFPKYYTWKKKQVENEKELSKLSKKRKNLSIVQSRGANCLTMFPWKPKHIQNLCFNIFSLLVVGPTQCGKTFFFEKILSTDCTLYESKKSKQIWWYYSQWQDRYKVMQSSIGKEWKIEMDLFAQGRSQRRSFLEKKQTHAP